MIEPDLDVARRFVALHPGPGRLVLCGVSGAHLYGFPSPDSDLDLKGLHVAPTVALLGLRPDTSAHDITEVLDGVECDLTTNELATALGLLVRGNGNMLERILSPWQLVESDEVADLQALARGAVSARFARHYRGFFHGCRREHEREPTVKTMLYSYRVALTGTHLLRTGQLEPDVRTLAAVYGYDDVRDLVARKGAGAEHDALDPAVDDHHRRRWDTLDALLAGAEAATTLPPDAPNTDDIERWLVRTRLAELDRSR